MRAIGRRLLRFRSCSDFERSEQRAKHYTLFYSSHSLSLSLLVPVGLGSLRETFTATSISVRVKNRSSPASLRLASLRCTALTGFHGWSELANKGSRRCCSLLSKIRGLQSSSPRCYYLKGKGDMKTRWRRNSFVAYAAVRLFSRIGIYEYSSSGACLQFKASSWRRGG